MAKTKEPDWPVKHPWSLLPRKGTHAFVPPRKDWLRNPSRGPKGGYVDRKGNEWVPHMPPDGDIGGFHGDVQHDDGDHTNVTPAGELHHGDDHFT